MSIPFSNRDEASEDHIPALENRAPEPRGVLRRNLKLQVYLGIAVLFIVATAVSSLRHKSIRQSAQLTPPLLPDSTASIEEMRRNLETQQRQAAAQAHLDQRQPDVADPNQLGPPPYAASETVPGYNCTAGQPCPLPQAPPYPAEQQLTPREQQQLQIEQQERELAYKARFASNLAYSQSHVIGDPSGLTPARQVFSESRMGGDNASAIPPHSSFSSLSPTTDSSGTQPPYVTQETPDVRRLQTQSGSTGNAATDPFGYRRAAEVNINSATGQPYVVYEGTLIETALMNRLDGDGVGPVKVLVTNPVYSHDHQHVLIPDGTVVLGECRKIGGSGFGQQRRLALAFHRLIMPDGYNVDLDQFQGLNQVGETGLKDKVNNHYFEIFGASIALGVIAGAAENSNNTGVLTPNGAEAYKYGVASNLSQSATNVLDQFINIPPTITIREGHRVKVYIRQDLLLPAYENHSILSSF